MAHDRFASTKTPREALLIAIAKQCSRQELWRRRHLHRRARLLWCAIKQPQLIKAYEREAQYRRRMLPKRARGPKLTMSRSTLYRQIAGWELLGCVRVQVRRVRDQRRRGRRRSLPNVYTLTVTGADLVRAIYAGARIPLISTDWEVPAPRRRA